jgi:ABC-2 type transport system ATP-binding protein
MPDLLDPADPHRGHPALIAPELTPVRPVPPLEETPQPVVLRVQRVSKWYGAVIGVNQVSLELRGGITGLVGANGAGKSTLLRLVAGHLRPDLGEVLVRGIPAWETAAKFHIGYCPDLDAFYEEMSGRQFVRTMAALCGYIRSEANDRADTAIERVGMADRADRNLRGYSKGMRQRVKLAQALVHDPDLLILDEPLSGIDPVGRAEFLDLFRSLATQGKCLLVSSHELDELEKLTEHVAIMARGRIAAVGSVADIRVRLDDHPLTVRLELEAPGEGDPTRKVAGAVLALADVLGVDLAEPLEERPRGKPGLVRLIVRARNPQRFFAELTRLVLEEWYEVRHLESLDDSTEAVLGYLLGAGGHR